MDYLKITIPDGYEFDSVEDGKMVLRPARRPVMERIKTVEDVLADHRLPTVPWEDQCKGLTPDEIAYRILKLLTLSLNEYWTPDWNDSSQSKYFPWFEMGGSSGFRFDDCAHWNSLSLVGSRLCFKTRELAEYAGKQFVEVYKGFMV